MLTHLLLPHFLSSAECSFINERLDAIGWAPAPVRFASGAQPAPELRNSERVELTDPQWAEELWARLIARHSPAELQSLAQAPGEARAMRPWFRGYRYTPGQRFGKHRDAQEKEGGLISRVTAIFYLNNTLNGEGATLVYPVGAKEAIAIAPSEGALLLFRSILLHEALAPILGVKRVLRSDLLFEA